MSEFDADRKEAAGSGEAESIQPSDGLPSAANPPVPREEAAVPAEKTAEPAVKTSGLAERSAARRAALNRIIDFLQDEDVQATGRIISAGAVQIGGKIAYEKIFSRYERPDYAVTPGLRCYERIADRLPRETFTFRSDNVNCAGYFYPAKPSKGLVAFAHGLHSGADDYLSIFEFLVKNGYSVIAYDTKGTYSSEGNSTVGLSESLVELDHLLDHVRETPVLCDMPLYVMGHSCGGFAASAVLLLHPEIRASVTMSAMENANTMIAGKGFLYSSILGIPDTPLTVAFLEETQKRLFGAYTELNGVRAVNESSCPILIAHGIKDMVVDYWSAISLISHAMMLRKENVYYYTGMDACGAHDTIWRSPSAVRYQEQLKKELDLLKKRKGRAFSREDEIAFVSEIDHARYSAVNEELFTKAVELYDQA